MIESLGSFLPELIMENRLFSLISDDDDGDMKRKEMKGREEVCIEGKDKRRKKKRERHALPFPCLSHPCLRRSLSHAAFGSEIKKVHLPYPPALA